MIIFEAILILSFVLNVLMGFRLYHNPHVLVEKEKVKEIEVVKKAICECDHASSFHDKTGKCRKQMFRLDGQVTKTAYECDCRKYTGPIPLTQVYDEQYRELETTRIDNG